MDRKIGLGGTDAMRIMKDDWHELYLEKRGQKEPEDLSDVFPVQLGKLTEDLHAEFFERRSGMMVAKPTKPTYFSTERDYMFGSLDRWIPSEGTFLELKHTHSNATLRDKASFYLPQLAHYCYVIGTRHCWFSIIKGNAEPEFCRVDVPEDYIHALLEMTEAFWWHVENRIAPDIMPTGKQRDADVMAREVPLNGLRPYKMDGSNEWADAAITWLTTKAEAKAHAEMADKLKELVPADASEAAGHGIVITRNKRGHLTLREAKEN